MRYFHRPIAYSGGTSASSHREARSLSFSNLTSSVVGSSTRGEAAALLEGRPVEVMTDVGGILLSARECADEALFCGRVGVGYIPARDELVGMAAGVDAMAVNGTGSAICLRRLRRSQTASTNAPSTTPPTTIPDIEVARCFCLPETMDLEAEDGEVEGGNGDEREEEIEEGDDKGEDDDRREDDDKGEDADKGGDADAGEDEVEREDEDDEEVVEDRFWSLSLSTIPLRSTLIALVWFDGEKIALGGPVHAPPYIAVPALVARSITASNCIELAVSHSS